MTYDFLRAYLSSDVPPGDREFVEATLRIATESPIDMERVRLEVEHPFSVRCRPTRYGTSFDVSCTVRFEFAGAGETVRAPAQTVLPQEDIGVDLRMYVKRFLGGCFRSVLTSYRLGEIVKKSRSVEVFADLFGAFRSKPLTHPGGLDPDLAIHYFKFFVTHAKRQKSDGGAFLLVKDILERYPKKVTVYEEENVVLVDIWGQLTSYDKVTRKVADPDPDLVARYKLFAGI